MLSNRVWLAAELDLLLGGTTAKFPSLGVSECLRGQQFAIALADCNATFRHNTRSSSWANGIRNELIIQIIAISKFCLKISNISNFYSLYFDIHVRIMKRL
jgi:hypothetical protein